MKLVIDTGVKAEPEPVLKFRLIQNSDSVGVAVDTPDSTIGWRVVSFGEVNGELRMRKISYIQDDLIATNDTGHILDY